MLQQMFAVPHFACAVPVSARGMDVSLMMDWLGFGENWCFFDGDLPRRSRASTIAYSASFSLDTGINLANIIKYT